MPLGLVPVVGEYYITANNNYKTTAAAVSLGSDRRAVLGRNGKKKFNDNERKKMCCGSHDEMAGGQTTEHL